MSFKIEIDDAGAVIMAKTRGRRRARKYRMYTKDVLAIKIIILNFVNQDTIRWFTSQFRRKNK